ncbi:hypothetical protein Desku_3366 [Desulfofundulus kuznetsovii DSM 6115]|uniref:Uncharacterized protein n=1 Tax=Desulfofundulus kuznetsovii (strain DSM 6115 / VKM B-1805 / 17) TaxID=760568 RepID=A0AAU8PHL2_DESK7|nr:hypothetical protein Desku_3366 [Desulfofundulus kuznetsovii DSM 6115]
MNSQKLLKQLEKKQKMFEEYLRQVRQGRKSKASTGHGDSRTAHK